MKNINDVVDNLKKEIDTSITNEIAFLRQRDNAPERDVMREDKACLLEQADFERSKRAILKAVLDYIMEEPII